jgi:Chaperone of endosialidase
MKNRNTIVIALLSALTCFALCQQLRSATDTPDPAGPLPVSNTADGQLALASVTTGIYNSAFGIYSLLSITDGKFCTGVGAGTLLANTGDENTATGAGALIGNTTGFRNTANGALALFSNTEGVDNTAIGFQALFNNTTDLGNRNTAVGSQALVDNTTGFQNTATGRQALLTNIDGDNNTATGFQALSFNTTGDINTAVGTQALSSNTEGSGNTAIGFNALLGSETGSSNIALGVNAGNSVRTASNVICVGSAGANVDNSCFIGNIYSNVQPIVGTDPDSVTITSAGRLGRGNVSSRRYKHDIKPMESASESLYALKPVSFRYNKEYDATQTLAFGLIAEEVAEVYPDLVGRNAKGEPESVRYEQINAMLLNEFLKEHRKVKQLEKQVEPLTAGLQKVSAQLEANRPAPQVVLNNP